jgi:hypothetical protein
MWLVGRASPQGELSFQKEPLLKISGWLVTVLASWIAYTIHLVKRDRRRERIRFARDIGRRICSCTEEGIITILNPDRTILALKVESCPRCKAEYIQRS